MRNFVNVYEDDVEPVPLVTVGAALFTFIYSVAQEPFDEQTFTDDAPMFRPVIVSVVLFVITALKVELEAGER